jgi:hypothetical protein
MPANWAPVAGITQQNHHPSEMMGRLPYRDN